METHEGHGRHGVSMHGIWAQVKTIIDVIIITSLKQELTIFQGQQNFFPNTVSFPT